MSEETADTDASGIMFRALNEIGIIAQLAGTAFERVMPGAMTLPQFAVLNHLARLGGNRTPLDLARAMQVTKGTMTNTLGHLERAGFISIAPDAKDKRSKRIDITATGLRARDAAIATLAPELRGLSCAVPAEEVAAILPMLERLRRALDARRDS
ncbi:MarR family winged helix-turn-helix transcriptional regulator [Elioraea rosea]|uniref:MarR family winged helix-turn-helix transcriptional regulator n=1 Tax=Elioraea rosea TaxID=2492390 RepID=UPI001182BE40|nr:MarR family transcriptional regulator [Elioraea rosea]